MLSLLAWNNHSTEYAGVRRHLQPSLSHFSQSRGSQDDGGFSPVSRVFSTRDNRELEANNPIPAKAANFDDCTYLLTLCSLSFSSFGFPFLSSLYSVVKCIIIRFVCQFFSREGEWDCLSLCEWLYIIFFMFMSSNYKPLLRQIAASNKDFIVLQSHKILCTHTI